MLRGFLFVIGLVMAGFGAIGLYMTISRLASGTLLQDFRALDPSMVMFIGISDIVGILGLLIIQGTWPTVSTKWEKAAASHPFIPRIPARPLLSVSLAVADAPPPPPRPSRFWRGLGFVLGILLALPGLAVVAFVGFGLADGTLIRDLSAPEGRSLAVVLAVFAVVGLLGVWILRWGWRGWRAAGKTT